MRENSSFLSNSRLKWEAVAPSNVALIKYMGKESEGKNHPLNSSLSLTVSHLQSKVELQLQKRKKETDPLSDEWKAFDSFVSFPSFASALFSSFPSSSPTFQTSSPSLELSGSEKNRFLNHLRFLKKKWNLSSHFIVRSSNNFPSACGLASSASSFAALTLCTEKAMKALMNKKQNEKEKLFYNQHQKQSSLMRLSQLSREASGSSCRSFFFPWSLWRKGSEKAEPIEGLPLLYHMVVVVKREKKGISSSEAHKRVMTSPLFVGRPERAEKRSVQLIQALREKNWLDAFSLTWSEFQDMQKLFETSSPSFSYLCKESLEVLEVGKRLWKEKQDGPLLTMDAGPNVHLFFRKDQREMAQKIRDIFNKTFLILSDPFLKRVS